MELTDSRFERYSMGLDEDRRTEMSAYPPTSTDPAIFEAVCAQCETLAVTFQRAEGALDSAPVFCSNCGRLRGLMGSIRKMAHESAAPHSSGLLNRP